MLELQGNISDTAKLTIYNMPALNTWRTAHAGKDIVMTLKVKRKTRSHPQNAYYWGVVIPLVTKAINDLGNDFDEEETHEFLKKEFNCKEIDVLEGHSIKMPQSTARLDTKEFMAYIENIQHFASVMLNTYLPSPNEQTSIDFSLNNQ